MNLFWSIRYVLVMFTTLHCIVSLFTAIGMYVRSNRNELWWARIRLIIQRFKIVIIECVCVVCLTDGKCILRWMHIISYKNVFDSLGCYMAERNFIDGCDHDQQANQQQQHVNIINSDLFSRNFFSLRSVFLATDLFSFSFIYASLVVSRSFWIVVFLYCACIRYWE